MSAELALASAIGWTVVAAIGLGVALRGLARRRAQLADVPPGLRGARLEGARNVRGSRVRCFVHGCNVAIGVLVLAARAGLVEAVAVMVAFPILLSAVAVALAGDDVADERHQLRVDADAGALLAELGAAPVAGGLRRYDPPARAAR